MHNRGLENPSKLDLIFTKNDLDIENLQYLAPLEYSHHSVLIFELLLEGSVVEVVDESLRYSHHKGDYVKAEICWRSLIGIVLLEKKLVICI